MSQEISQELQVRSLESRWLGMFCAREPVAASRLGLTAFGAGFPDYSPNAQKRYQEERLQLLRELNKVNREGLPLRFEHDVRLLEADVSKSCLLYELEPWRRAPYIYPEEAGAALHSMLADEELTQAVRDGHLLDRLVQLPQFLDRGKRNLEPDEVPPVWLEMGLSAAKGFVAFLERDLPRYLDSSTLASVEFAEPLESAQEAARGFLGFLQDMEGKARGSYAVGRQHVHRKLSEYHLLEGVTCDSLLAFGEKRVKEERARLLELASQLGPDLEWTEVLERIKDDHPEPEGLLDTYREARDSALAHIIEHDLITVPDAQYCTIEQTPVFLRASIPLGVMHTSAPFARGDDSKLLITPIDPEAPAERQRDHLREQNAGFIRSITFHEIYPGHHLQSVLHKRAPGIIRKLVRNPLFVEGWGLYTEDLMEETGYLGTPKLQFLKARNALWRAVRVVIDMGLHTGELSVEDSIHLLMDEVGQGSHMARGEVLRYTRHDNPTYQSCYMYGKTMIRELRDDYRRKLGSEFSLGRFHDDLLAHGSPPVQLIREMLLQE